jgi:hypothetical protein
MLVIRAQEIGQARVLAAIALAGHVLVGGFGIAVPGRVSMGAVNAAVLSGLLAGAAVCFSVASPTPWWAWGARRRPAAMTAVPLAVALAGLLALAWFAELVTARPAVVGWAASMGFALIVLSVVPRPAAASMITSAVTIALVAAVPAQAPGSLVGLSAATWYAAAPPLGSHGAPPVLLTLGVLALLTRVALTRRTVRT